MFTAERPDGFKKNFISITSLLRGLAVCDDYENYCVLVCDAINAVSWFL
jgi:hypothetical protein